MTTANQDFGVRVYQKQFKELLQAVFGYQAYFGDFFAGGLEALDGVAHNKIAFTVKTSDIPVVFGEYNTGANVAFGTGTANSSRFGEMKEIVYTDTDVPYTWNWAIHEGLDKFTVNAELDAAVARRLELQAQAKVKMFNEHHSKFISDNAGKELTLENMSDDKDKALLKLFNAISAHYVNNHAIGQPVANVNTELYARIVDHPLMTTAKNSQTNIDNNSVVKFKGITIRETPDSLFQTGESAYVYIPNVGKAFTGIVTARAIPGHQFEGVEIQGAGKAGEFIIEDNKKAVIKIKQSPSA